MVSKDYEERDLKKRSLHLKGLGSLIDDFSKRKDCITAIVFGYAYSDNGELYLQTGYIGSHVEALGLLHEAQKGIH